METVQKLRNAIDALTINHRRMDWEDAQHRTFGDGMSFALSVIEQMVPEAADAKQSNDSSLPISHPILESALAAGRKN